ncbi:MAG: alpha/beta fold hydrolase [Pseudomonadota bacterium]
MTNDTSKPGVNEEIVDHLYDIALDPGELDRFINTWNEAGLDAERVRRTVTKIDAFDSDFQSHLERATTFLERHKTPDRNALLQEALEPFDASPALILDAQLQIVALNTGAKAAYGLIEGGRLDTLDLYEAEQEELSRVLSTMVHGSADQNVLLNFESVRTGRPVIFHVKRVTQSKSGTALSASPLVLVVTTEFFWPVALNETLGEVFSLSSAELGIVQALVEGNDAKSIAAARGTSIETVRTQIRNVLGKTKSGSQTELIRLVLTMRDVVGKKEDATRKQNQKSTVHSADWLDAEVWKPFETIKLKDGRVMHYHVQGPMDGAPILFSHMGYCQVRWSRSMLKQAYRHGLKVICPIRAGYGDSDQLDRKADVLASLADDTVQLLDHLKIDKLPYVVQGNDLLFACDLAVRNPERVSEIIGLGARPFLHGDQHYAAMSAWHRFFLSTAQHAPHLLFYTIRAGFTLARKLGSANMFARVNSNSPADLRLLEDPEMLPVLEANGQLSIGDKKNAATAYAMELLETEGDWSDTLHKAKNTPTWFVNGMEDPLYDSATISAYREQYPWIDIETVEQGGQLLIFLQYKMLIPRIAEAARRAKA